MRRVSPTNSRPAENKSVWQDYRDSVSVCECWRYIVQAGLDKEQTFSASNWKFWRFHYIPGGDSQKVEAGEIHHLFGSRGGRHDLRSNLLGVHGLIHLWLDRNKHAGQIICLHAKLLKGGPDFVPSELREASGGQNFPELLEVYELDNPVLRRWREEIVAAVLKMESGERGAA